MPPTPSCGSRWGSAWSVSWSSLRHTGEGGDPRPPKELISVLLSCDSTFFHSLSRHLLPLGFLSLLLHSPSRTCSFSPTHFFSLFVLFICGHVNVRLKFIVPLLFAKKYYTFLYIINLGLVGSVDLMWRIMWRGLGIGIGRERTKLPGRRRWRWLLCWKMGLLVLARLLWMNWHSGKPLPSPPISFSLSKDSKICQLLVISGLLGRTCIMEPPPIHKCHRVSPEVLLLVLLWQLQLDLSTLLLVRLFPYVLCCNLVLPLWRINNLFKQCIVQVWFWWNVLLAKLCLLLLHSKFTLMGVESVIHFTQLGLFTNLCLLVLFLFWCSMCETPVLSYKLLFSLEKFQPRIKECAFTFPSVRSRVWYTGFVHYLTFSLATFQPGIKAWAFILPSFRYQLLASFKIGSFYSQYA